MKISQITVGSMGTNCYLISDEKSNHTLILDPGDEPDFITSTILEKQLKPVGILMTHGHFDHCLGVLELKLNFGIPSYLHHKDIFLYEKAHQSARHFAGTIIPKLPKIDHPLTGSESIKLGDTLIKVISTPGHTPGSVCYYVEKDQTLFTGDTLFSDNVGRTDRSYSSKNDLHQSLESLSSLNPDSISYPGHGESFILSNSLHLYL